MIRPLACSALGLALVPGLALSTLLACGGDDGRGSASGASAPTGVTGASGTGNTDGSSSSSGGGESTSGGVTASGSTSEGSSGSSTTDPGSTSDASASTTDPGSTSDATTLDPTTSTSTDGTSTGDDIGCERVDFLFVIDNSSSMEAKQAALKASFPQFIATIQNTVKAQDYHIMVVDTDAWGKCTENECAKGPDKNEVCNAYICNTEFTECDMTLGAGVIHPAGKVSSNKLCDVYGGNRYLLSSDPDLTGTFSCVAKLGIAGNGKERPMDAMVAALAGPINANKGCNAGFLRDDAILVITMITDDPNMEDLTPVQQAYDAIVASKKGDADRIVLLGLIPDPSMSCPADKPQAGVHWAQLVDKFGDHGIKAPVCVLDYNAFFQEAVAIIDDTCKINPG
ncbi:MAG: hypothetical protein R3B09_20085 [Nannocystaceae bacterium]